MIPRSRTKAPADVDDIDIIDVELEPMSDPVLTLADEDVVLEEPSRPKLARRSHGHVPVSPDSESRLADDCLSSIADAVFKSHASDAVLANARLRERSPVDDLLAEAPVGDLPPPSMPPRPAMGAVPSSPLRLPPISFPPAPDEPEGATLPFRRRSSEPLFARTGVTSAPSAETAPPFAISVAPVALSSGERASQTPVVVVRERPRLAWVVAAAAVGAIAAVSVMRLAVPRLEASVEPATALAVHANRPAPPATPEPAAQHPAQAPAQAAPAEAPAQAAPAEPAVVHFGDKDSVVIATVAAANASPTATPPVAKTPTAKAPQPKAPAPNAPQPKPKVSAPIAMPDGSLGLASRGKASSPSPAATAAPAAPPPAAPPPKPRKPRTPEQELAAAQLRAAAR